MGMAIQPVGNGYPTPEPATPERQHELHVQRQHEVEDARRIAHEQASAQTLDTTARQLEQVSLAFNKKLRFEVNKDLEQVWSRSSTCYDKVVKNCHRRAQRLQIRIAR